MMVEAVQEVFERARIWTQKKFPIQEDFSFAIFILQS